jgi:hypothetical protein
MRSLIVILMSTPLLGTACGRSAPHPGEDGAAPSCGFDGRIDHDPLGEVLQLVSADEQSCVYLYRENPYADSDDLLIKSIPFVLHELTVGHGELLESITDPDALSYEASHHNFLDTAEAWGEQARYELLLVLCDYDPDDGGWVGCFELSAHDLDSDEVLWGPVELSGW